MAGRGAWRWVAAAAMWLSATCGVAMAHDFRQAIQSPPETIFRQFSLIEGSSLDQSEKQRLRGAIQKNAYWQKSVLTVCFGAVGGLMPYGQLIHRIMSVAQEWTYGTDLSFDHLVTGRVRECQGNSSADIRVSIGHAGSNTARFASAVGTQSRTSIANSPEYRDLAGYSMVLEFTAEAGCLRGPQTCTDADDPVFRFLVLHEFGHALGFVHEHQRLDCGLRPEIVKAKWLKDWSLEKIKAQIGFLEEYAAATLPAGVVADLKRTFGTAYDKNSIMQYNGLDPSFYKHPELCLRDSNRSEISLLDRAVVVYVYSGRHLRG